MKQIHLFIAFLILTLSAYSQNPTRIVSVVQDNDTIYSQGKIKESKTDILLGVGFGADYGFLGAKLTFYPIKNFGLFGGVGFVPLDDPALAYNIGVTVNFLSNKLQIINQKELIVPGIQLMYGTNTVVKIIDSPELDKLFPGFTFGLVNEFRFRRNFYASIGVLIPIMSSEAKTYIDNLGAVMTSYYGFPVKITIGIGFIF